MSAPPTARQMAYLKGLALQRNETFVMPETAAQASTAINRAKYRPRDRTRWKKPHNT